MDRNTVLTIVLGFIIVGALGVIVKYITNPGGPDQQDGITELLETPEPTQSPVYVPRQVNGPVDENQAAMDYTQAVKEFGGHRVQFGLYCQAIPQRMVFKAGDKVMLDNRSGDARIITLGGMQHSLEGYGWKIVTLEPEKLPASLMLDCGSAVSVGEILVQD